LPPGNTAAPPRNPDLGFRIMAKVSSPALSLSNNTVAAALGGGPCSSAKDSPKGELCFTKPA
jgi:hypothetical protein